MGLAPSYFIKGFDLFMKRYAEFRQVKLNDDDAIQYITDSMANKMNIQIEYQGSGWRTVLPYSFTTSKDNNLLVMCYKQDGSVRSYRFDRIDQLFVDDALMTGDSGNGTGVNFSEAGETSHSDMSDFEIPYLPEYDEILELSESEEGEPFQEAIDTLEEGEMFEPQLLDEDGNPIEEDDDENFELSENSTEMVDNSEETDYDLDGEDNEEENSVDFDLDNGQNETENNIINENEEGNEEFTDEEAE